MSFSPPSGRQSNSLSVVMVAPVPVLPPANYSAHPREGGEPGFSNHEKHERTRTFKFGQGVRAAPCVLFVFFVVHFLRTERKPAPFNKKAWVPASAGMSGERTRRAGRNAPGGLAL